MIKKILYASDLGVLSAYSLAYVEQLAKQFKAKVDLLHVVPPIDALASAVLSSHCSEEIKNEVLASVHIESLLETIRDQTFERLMEDELGIEFSRNLNDIVVRTGAPAKTIVDYSASSGADIIVIGNCSEFSGYAPSLGSVATKVLQMATVPVFMVPVGTASAIPKRHIWKCATQRL